MARPLSCFLVTIQTEAGMVRKIVDDNPFTIGRSLEAAIAFSDNNISRAHVMVRNKNGKVMVEDQGSANGTYVNGVRLEARKSIPVEPKDVVRLGNSRVELTFTAIEKVFAENLVDQSDLPDEERDSIIDMLHGAHAEAQRLVKLGKDIHDNIIKSAEDRARTVEQNISGERDLVLTRAKELSAQTIEQARSTATQIISAAEEDAKKAVAAIHQRAAEVREQAEEYRHSQVAAAQSQADEVIQQSDKICQEMLQEAKNRINEITEVAKIQGRELVVKSKQEAESLIAAAIRESERIKKETEDDVSNARALAESDARQLRADAHKEADQLKLDSLNEAEKIKKDAQIEIEKRAKESLAEALNEGALKSEEMMLQAREKAQIERDTLISKAEESLRETRHEKKKLEGEMATNLKRMRGELDQLNTELENQQRLMQQKRKVFDDEVAYLRELKEREAQSIFDEKIKEAEIMAKQKLQEAEKIKTLKEEEADVYVQSKKLEFEKIKRRSEEQVADLQAKIKELTPKCNHQAEELKSLETAVAQAQEKLGLLTPQAAAMQEELTKTEQTKAFLQANIKELETRQGHLTREKQVIEEDLNTLKLDRDARIAEQKSILEVEIARMRKEQQTQLDQLRLEEMGRIKSARSEMIESLIKDRQKIANEIFNQIELEVVKFCKSGDWIEASPTIQQKINEALEEKSITMVTSQQSETTVSNLAVRKRKRSERWLWLAQGVAAGAILFYGTERGYQIYLDDLNPMKTAADTRAREAAEDLERRKFNPPKDDQWRDTYAGTVIYTLNFVENYQNADFQEKWLKACTTYLLKQWRIEEDKTIEVLSMVNTLVNTLQERKDAIHPDYVQDGLKKMDTLETETIDRVKKLLGGEVRFEAFRRYEKRFYQQYYEDRAPATNDTEEKEE